MKILAIRGENLASLHGRFAVELAQPPLARAGLFAITGPTGAGKSTLLDAMCLALFGRTPRVGGKSGFEVADPSGTVGVQSPAQLLRRGAVAASAEVDFEGIDGKAYRATWAIRRARLKADGKPQAAELTLTALEGGQRLGSKAGEVLEATERLLGLNFDQFRRSVLLAQGEFAAFLRANASERAELLEKATGTGHFRQLSTAAFEAVAERRRRLDLLLEGQKGELPLEPGLRTELEAQRAEAGQGFESARVALELRRAELSWFEQEARLAGALSQAQRELVAAEAPLAGLSIREAEAAAVRAVLPLAEAFAESERLALQLPEVTSRFERSASARVAAEGARTAAELALSEATKAQDAWQAGLPEVNRLLGEARLQQERVGALQGELRQSQSRLQPVVERLKEGEAQSLRLTEQRSVLERDRREHEGWSGRRAPWFDAVARRETLRPQLERLAVLEREVAERKLASEQHGLQQGEARRQLDQAESEHRIARIDHERLKAEVARREADPQLRDGRTFDAMTVEWNRKVAQLEIAERLDQQSRGATAAIDRLDHALERLHDRLEQGLAEQGAVAHQVDEAGLSIREARARLEGARRVESLESQRHALVEGEPCPLCGSESHPWGAGRTPHPVVDAFQRELLQAEAREAALRRQLDQLRDQLTAHRGEEAKHRAERSAQHAQRDAARREWDAQLSGLFEESVHPGDEALPHRIGADRLHAREALADLVERRKTVTGLEEQLAKLIGQRTEAEQRFNAAQTLRAERETNFATLRAVQEQLQGERERAEQSLAALAIEAVGAEQLGEERWAGRLEALVRRTGEFEAWQQRGLALDAAMQELKPKQEALRGQLEELEQRRQAHASEVEAVGLRLREGQGALEALLQGRALEGWSSEVERTGQARAAAERSAREQRELASRNESEARLAEVAARGELERHQQRSGEVEALLNSALAAQAIPRQELVRRLALGASFVAAAEREGTEARTRVAEARAVAGKAQLAAEGHAASRPPGEGDGVAARTALQSAESEQASRAQALGGLEERLREDDGRRQRGLARAAELERAQADLSRWELLNDLIGAKTGDKFALVAQGLTLEVLLEAANAHLAEFAPRYRLQQVKSALLELEVIDLEMGSEVRGLPSLSGGEGFLVSLALALGLSSLQARGRTVASLFIDEGFGTLDPESLDAALDALDALQASGRQVGVISHVPGLVDRIGTEVRVVKRGAGSSVVRVIGLDGEVAPPSAR